MGLKLVYLVVTRVFVWLWLAGRDSAVKDVEILMLRHQLTVAQRRDPRLSRKLNWVDRAWLVLLAGLLPRDRLARVRLIVAPGTLLRWHRDLLRRRWARRSRRRPGRPTTHRNVRALVLRMARENFDAVFTVAGVDVIRTGVRAPRQNSAMERWFGSLRAELTDRTLIWNLDPLMRLLRA